MKSEIDITIGVTCYNEQDSIVPTLETLVAALEENSLEGEIVIMDDASDDSSVALVRRFTESRSDLRWRLHVNEINRGMVWNVYEAAAQGSGRYYWYVSGDSNVTREACAKLFAHIGEADIVIPDVSYENRSWHRNVISRFYGGIVNLLSGYRIRYYNGSSIYAREDVVLFRGMITEFSYSADMINRLLDLGRTFVEVPVVYNDRTSGSSSALSGLHLMGVIAFFARLVLRRFSGARRRPTE